MSLKNDEQMNMASDSAYGGCQYRLSYDLEKTNKIKRTSPVASFASNALVVTLIVAVFLILGMFIFTYYKNAVKNIFRKNDSDSTLNNPQYSNSNVNVIIE